MNREDRLAADGVPEGVEPVLFYGHRNALGLFSNFSWHEIWLPNPWTREVIEYPTGEHRYQAMKAVTQEEHDYVFDAPKAYDSKERGREITLRDDWGNDYGDYCWYVMLETVLAKTKHASVRKALKATGTRPIYEDSPVDDIWGWRFQNDYRGKNLLGRAWMAVRYPFV